jgi:hypothetical protein
LAAKAASRALFEPMRNEPGMIRTFGADISGDD